MNISMMRALKTRLRRYPRLVRAYAEIQLFIQSLKRPVWEVRIVNGEPACAHGHIQESFDIVDGRRACLLCFAADIPYLAGGIADGWRAGEAWLAPGTERSGSPRWL